MRLYFFAGPPRPGGWGGGGDFARFALLAKVGKPAGKITSLANGIYRLVSSREILTIHSSKNMLFSPKIARSSSTRISLQAVLNTSIARATWCGSLHVRTALKQNTSAVRSRGIRRPSSRCKLCVILRTSIARATWCGPWCGPLHTLR